MATAAPENRATVERGSFDGEPTWILTHPDGARLVVAETGATLLAWQVPGPDGGPVDLLDGYASAAELEAQDGYRNAVLVPWSNRVHGAVYTFAGQRHELAADADGEALHGLVAGTRFTRAQVAASDSDRMVRLRTSLAPGDHPGYPFALDVTVTYSLGVGSEGEARLDVEISVVNTGDDPAPVALGWHPYLRLPGHAAVDDLDVTIPARARVLTDEDLIPLAGEQAYAGVAAPARYAPLGTAVLDDAFTHLVPDEDGVVATVVRSPRTGATLTVEQEPDQARVVHVFTGDTLDRDPRTSVAVEPCQLLADAFNRADTAKAIALAPGARRQLVSGIVYRRG
ncbi:aldose 1-epimerase [Georgenia ruanii]|uniref:Aldose 1-epimerase n=1 Tax=Georgenia ruanii TaxID=348442 RepID=A0A7J9UV81_9MICO|nr:aldose 1-epimerase [Georgenia ruanii]MPV88263.1 aldose 1-epimerase [Georgenia ruanii]